MKIKQLKQKLFDEMNKYDLDDLTDVDVSIYQYLEFDDEVKK